MISCNKKGDPDPVTPSGKVVLTFSHRVTGEPLQENKLIYTNAAGNLYMISEVKYFISDIIFYKSDGSHTLVDDWKDIFYIDEDISATKSIQIFDPVPEGQYDSVTFIFGIKESKNKSMMFVNPPEVNMAWPDVLGGGYHYMMINGKWKDLTGYIEPFNFHLGIGQLYHSSGYEIDSIYAFVQNYFTVNLPASGFTIHNQETLTINIVMNIEKWFDSPQVFDFNFWGGAIMQNQAAMQVARNNGRNVFSISSFRIF